MLKWGHFQLAGGDWSHWKIECEDLTDEDIQVAAFILKDLIPPFVMARGVPEGGKRLASALNKYANRTSSTIIVADDVYTTGKTIEDFKQRVRSTTVADNFNIYGAVLFARKPTPEWVIPLFALENKSYVT